MTKYYISKEVEILEADINDAMLDIKNSDLSSTRGVHSVLVGVLHTNEGRVLLSKQIQAYIEGNLEELDYLFAKTIAFCALLELATAIERVTLYK